MTPRSPSRPSPTDVFTPTGLPIAEGNAYAHRVGPEQDIVRYLARGQVPLVFGEYGVGKTTLVRKVIRDSGKDSQMVYIPTASNKAVSDIFKVVLEKYGFKVVMEEHRTDSRGARAGAKLIFEGDFHESAETKTVSAYIVDSPTDDRVIQLLRDKEVTLVIDELHRASDNFRAELVDLIKSTQGQDAPYPKIVLIGTALEASNLVELDHGIDRFVKELPVRPMTSDESAQIVDSGFSLMRVEISDELKSLIVGTAAGAPTLIQSLCLDMVESCLNEQRYSVTHDDYRQAVKRYLIENGRRLADAYTEAIEHTGPKRYRKQILISMSLMDDEYFELEAVRAHIEERTGAPVAQSALSGPLRTLKNGRESILQDLRRRDGERVYNVSSFRDPMMKSFIRFMNELEAQGIVQP